MLNDAAKALSQMVSPPLRAVLWKSIALALALITVIAVGLDSTHSNTCPKAQVMMLTEEVGKVIKKSC